MTERFVPPKVIGQKQIPCSMCGKTITINVLKVSKAMRLLYDSLETLARCPECALKVRDLMVAQELMGEEGEGCGQTRKG